MRIGLIRHFKVQVPKGTSWMSSIEFEEWVARYDVAPIEHDSASDIGSEWEICYSSDMNRAVRTAESLYQGEIVQTEALREIGIGPLFRTHFKIHISLWLLLGRMGWLWHHRSQERKTETLRRAKEFLTSLEARGHRNVLVVTHGAFMTVLRDELLRDGYSGERFIHPTNGKLYSFRKER